MKYNLKKVKDQVIVITGASSGIGLSTARRAAKRGAKVFLISRNRQELERICDEITAQGGEAGNYAADVADAEAMVKASQAAIERFGRIDTWVNNAGVSIYGKLTEVSLEDKRRLFDTNFWGVINGCRAALPHLKKSGGALINLGSVLSERAIPLQGIYVASKHAVKGYTDSLRMELMADHLPVAVTLIEPAAINTPYTEHVKNYTESMPSLPPPLYSPSVVADAIIHCAQSYHRTVQIGGAAKVYTWGETFMPGTTDKLVNATGYKSQLQGDKDMPRQDSLYHHPLKEGKEEGSNPGYMAQSSLYTSTKLHPGRASLIAGTTAVALTAAWLGFRSKTHSHSQSLQ